MPVINLFIYHNNLNPMHQIIPSFDPWVQEESMLRMLRGDKRGDN